MNPEDDITRSLKSCFFSMVDFSYKFSINADRGKSRRMNPQVVISHIANNLVKKLAMFKRQHNESEDLPKFSSGSAPGCRYLDEIWCHAYLVMPLLSFEVIWYLGHSSYTRGFSIHFQRCLILFPDGLYKCMWPLFCHQFRLFKVSHRSSSPLFAQTNTAPCRLNN